MFDISIDCKGSMREALQASIAALFIGAGLTDHLACRQKEPDLQNMGVAARLGDQCPQLPRGLNDNASQRSVQYTATWLQLLM